MKYWAVDQGVTSSDHNTILLKIRGKEKGINIQRTTRLYNTKKANWDIFMEKIDQFLAELNFNVIEISRVESKQRLEDMVKLIKYGITLACRYNMHDKVTNTKFPIPWRSEELALLKK